MNLYRYFYTFIFIVLTLFNTTIFSNNTTETIIEGIIVDGNNKGIPGVEVIIPETGEVVKTSATGQFIIRTTQRENIHLEINKNGFIPSSVPQFKTLENQKIQIPKIILLPSPKEEIVVTGTSTPKFYWETPVKTAVISENQIEKKGAVSLADSLEIATGVRVEDNCQNCNFTQVRINGMEGKYCQILFDGLPMVSSLAGVYGLEQIPANRISRLEVVKGGGSALYGGNAVAGVVNVITKEPEISQTSISLTGESISGSLNSNLTINTDYVSRDEKIKASFFSDYQRREPVFYNDDDFSDIGEITHLSVGSNVIHNLDQIGAKLLLNFSYIFEDRRGGNKLDLPEHFADIAESARTNRMDAGLSWEQKLGDKSLLRFNNSVSNTKRKSYYGGGQNPNAYGNTKNPVVYSNLTYSNYSIDHHTLLAGISFRSDKIKDIAPAYNRTIDSTYTELGILVQDDMELFNDTVGILLGIRGDKHSEVENIIFSPRVSLLYNGIPDLTFRGTFSTGFRAPQVFDEDFHITMIGGEGHLIVNQPNLHEERSHSFTVGIDYGKQKKDRLFRFSINGFYNELNDVFTMREIEPLPNARVFERFNSDGGAKVYGMEFEIGFKKNRRFEFFTGWTFQKSRLDFPEPDFGSKKMFRSPDIYGFARLDFNLNASTDCFVEMNYTGSMYVPHYAGYIANDILEKTESFIVINVNVSKKFQLLANNSITISAAVNNLFDSYQEDLDKGPYRDAGYIYGPRFPRVFRIGIKYDF